MESEIPRSLRDTSAQEITELHQAAEQLKHAVLLSPHGHPLKTMLPFLREAVPELVSLLPHNMVIVAVAAYHDATCEVSHEFSRGIAGCVCVDRQWTSGPAYRTLPDLYSVPIDQLQAEISEPMVQRTDGTPPA